MNNPVARILDVNRNRAGEALRTMEEYARFVMNSPVLTARCKALRHDLAALAKAFSAASLDSRDIAADVGADIRTEAEGSRPDAAAVAAAAARRGAESLRVLAEYAKIDHPEAAAGFERLRYAVYGIEPLLLANAALRDKLASARLYVLITTSLTRTDPLTAAKEICAGGADVIQLREKEMEDGEFHALAAAMADICREAGVLFLINDRPHIASLVDASGVHGGQGDLPVALTRRLLGPEKIIGRSTSAPEFAQRALADGADYIGVGPVFPTNTKRHRAAAGTEYVRWASRWREKENGLPYFAIGGVNRGTVDQVIAAGARAVAICTGITMAEDIAAETAFFRQRLRIENALEQG